VPYAIYMQRFKPTSVVHTTGVQDSGPQLLSPWPIPTKKEKKKKKKRNSLALLGSAVYSAQPIGSATAVVENYYVAHLACCFIMQWNFVLRSSARLRGAHDWTNQYQMRQALRYTCILPSSFACLLLLDGLFARRRPRGSLPGWSAFFSSRLARTQATKHGAAHAETEAVTGTAVAATAYKPGQYARPQPGRQPPARGRGRRASPDASQPGSSATDTSGPGAKSDLRYLDTQLLPGPWSVRSLDPGTRGRTVANIAASGPSDRQTLADLRPQTAPQARHGGPTAEVVVPTTSRDGRAGRAPQALTPQRAHLERPNK
jgi:hypothetical protein